MLIGSSKRSGALRSASLFFPHHHARTYHPRNTLSHTRTPLHGINPIPRNLFFLTTHSLSFFFSTFCSKTDWIPVFTSEKDTHNCVSSAEISPNGNLLAMCTKTMGTGTCRLFSRSDEAATWTTIPYETPADSFCECLAFTPNGDFLLMAFNGIGDVHDELIIRRQSTLDLRAPPVEHVLSFGCRVEVFAADFAPTSSADLIRVACAFSPKSSSSDDYVGAMTVCVWELKPANTGLLTQRFTLDDASYFSACRFSRDGLLLAVLATTCAKDYDPQPGRVLSSHVHVYHLATGVKRTHAHKYRSSILSVEWLAADGLAFLDDKGRVQVLNVLIDVMRASYTDVQCLTSFRRHAPWPGGGAALVFKSGLVQLLDGYDGQASRTVGAWPDIGDAHYVSLSQNGKALLATFALNSNPVKRTSVLVLATTTP